MAGPTDGNVQDHGSGGTAQGTTPSNAHPMIRSLELEIKSVRELWGREKYDHRKTRKMAQALCLDPRGGVGSCSPRMAVHRRDRHPSRSRVCRPLEVVEIPVAVVCRVALIRARSR